PWSPTQTERAAEPSGRSRLGSSSCRARRNRRLDEPSDGNVQLGGDPHQLGGFEADGAGEPLADLRLGDAEHLGEIVLALACADHLGLDVLADLSPDRVDVPRGADVVCHGDYDLTNSDRMSRHGARFILPS